MGYLLGGNLWKFYGDFKVSCLPISKSSNGIIKILAHCTLKLL